MCINWAPISFSRPNHRTAKNKFVLLCTSGHLKLFTKTIILFFCLALLLSQKQLCMYLNWANMLSKCLYLYYGSLCLIRFIPESLRWQISTKRYAPAIQTIKRIAKLNGTDNPLTDPERLVTVVLRAVNITIIVYICHSV